MSNRSKPCSTPPPANLRGSVVLSLILSQFGNKELLWGSRVVSGNILRTETLRGRGNWMRNVAVAKTGTFFSMAGRLNRLRYFGYSLAIGFVTYPIAFFVGTALVSNGIIGTPDDLANGTELAFFAISVGFVFVSPGTVIISALQIVKRLHDLDRPGTHFWLMLIPFYNVYLGWVLLFKKGTTGPNQYGNDPLVAVADANSVVPAAVPHTPLHDRVPTPFPPAATKGAFCRDCGSPAGDSKFCPHCGQPQTPSNICSRCGTQLRVGSTFCAESGAKSA